MDLVNLLFYVKLVLNAVTQSCGLPPESGEQLRHTSYEDDVDE